MLHKFRFSQFSIVLGAINTAMPIVLLWSWNGKHISKDIIIYIDWKIKPCYRWNDQVQYLNCKGSEREVRGEAAWIGPVEKSAKQEIKVWKMAPRKRSLSGISSVFAIFSFGNPPKKYWYDTRWKPFIKFLAKPYMPWFGQSNNRTSWDIWGQLIHF